MVSSGLLAPLGHRAVERKEGGDRKQTQLWGDNLESG